MQDNRLQKISPQEATHLVFNGGGIKGLAHVMAYAAMVQSGVNPGQIRGCNGTSAGSIMSTMVAFRHSIDEMFNIMTHLNFIGFLGEDGKKTLAPKFVKAVQKQSAGPLFFKGPTIAKRIAKTGGMFNAHTLNKFMNDMIEEKTGIKNCTFAEARKWCQERGLPYIDLQLVAYNETKRLSETFSLENSPNVVIADAVVASCSVKGVFERRIIRVKFASGLVPRSNDQYSDGGLDNNYDIRAWDLTPNGDELFNRHVLGFMLTSAEEAAYIQGVRDIPTYAIEPGALNFVKTGFDQLTSAQNSHFLNTPKDIVRTIAIDNKGVSTFSLDLENDRPLMQALLESGWNSACAYFGQALPYPAQYKVDNEIEINNEVEADSESDSGFDDIVERIEALIPRK